ncbi:hypothetical protein SAMN04488032_10460 [Pacificibacter marinus]|uniref:Uncharacterized protein n=2 Tax=Pacificibacter marinus TaxID=658057 RepID=A0A1Y5SK94_9RHOB|nr:hypothetical protein SAMN04488032_10460 [Pacificibacter marinus]SLN42389.1 hypothetical protein PAM7971_02017 [Pacificibacter marinus]
MRSHLPSSHIFQQVFMRILQIMTAFACKYALFNDTDKRYFLASQIKARTTVGVTILAASAVVTIDPIARRPQENA